MAENKKPYQALIPVLRIDARNNRLSFDDSLDRTIREMERNLAEIAEERKYNNMPITEDRIAECIELCLRPVLDAAKAVHECVSLHGSFTTGLWVDDAEDAELFAHSCNIDLTLVESKLVNAFNHWLAFLVHNSDLPQPDIPLASNHPAVDDPSKGVDSLRDIIRTQGTPYPAVPRKPPALIA